VHATSVLLTCGIGRRLHKEAYNILTKTYFLFPKIPYIFVTIQICCEKYLVSLFTPLSPLFPNSE
jgi:hypothetical protein